MEKALKTFKRTILIFVLIILMAVITLSAGHLLLVGIREVLAPPRFLLDVGDLTTMLGIILLLVIGLELVESVEVAFHDSSNLHKLVEIIVLIAIIAIGRKIIILDLTHLEPFTLVGIAAILVALTTGYSLLRKFAPELEDAENHNEDGEVT